MVLLKNFLSHLRFGLIQNTLNCKNIYNQLPLEPGFHKFQNNFVYMKKIMYLCARIKE